MSTLLTVVVLVGSTILAGIYAAGAIGQVTSALCGLLAGF